MNSRNRASNSVATSTVVRINLFSMRFGITRRFAKSAMRISCSMSSSLDASLSSSVRVLQREFRDRSEIALFAADDALIGVNVAPDRGDECGVSLPSKVRRLRFGRPFADNTRCEFVGTKVGDDGSMKSKMASLRVMRTQNKT